MKLIIQNGRISGTATDEYIGDEITINAPSDFDLKKISEYRMIDGIVSVPISSIENDIVIHTQLRLDEFAQTRRYDGIMSACTYANSSIPTFCTEGKYAVIARDTTWAALYNLLSEVEAGTRKKPTCYEDIEALLPILTWPI